jgi:predicted transport protein
VARELSEFICSLDASVIEVPQKLYVAYKLAKNIACMEVHKKEILITLPLKFEADMPDIARDLTGIGHWGTGDLELRVKDAADVETACEIIRRSYLENGGS